MSRDIPPELLALLAARGVSERDAAWDAFIARYSRLLAMIAREYGGNHDDAMDRYAVILERLREDECRRLRAWTRDRRSALTTWLGVIARRACVDELRRVYGRARDGSDAEAELLRQRRRLADLVTTDLAPDLDIAEHQDTIVDAELTVRRAELRARLEQSVNELPPNDQLLLTLRFRDERTAADIAAILRFASPFHVYRQLERVAARLREAMRHRGVEDLVP